MQVQLGLRTQSSHDDRKMSRCCHCHALSTGGDSKCQSHFHHAWMVIEHMLHFRRIIPSIPLLTHVSMCSLGRILKYCFVLPRGLSRAGYCFVLRIQLSIPIFSITNVTHQTPLLHAVTTSFHGPHLRSVEPNCNSWWCLHAFYQPRYFDKHCTTKNTPQKRKVTSAPNRALRK